MTHHATTIEFHGICTFVSRDTVPGLPTPWRAVLLNASRGADIRGIHIGPHHAFLEITLPGGTKSSKLPLKGYAMSLTATFRPEFRPTTDFFKLPNLTDLMREVEPLHLPNDEVVLHGDPAKAAAFFDLDMGGVTAGLNAFLAATTVVTIDVPVTLQITPFQGVEPPQFETVELPVGARVKISNEDEAKHEGAPGVDFLLHYLTSTSLPLVPQVPQNLNLPFIVDYQTVGAGCSNSTYP